MSNKITKGKSYFISTDIIIRNILLPTLAKSGCQVTPYKLWSGNAGRSSITGLSTGDIVAIKYGLVLTWDVLYDDDFDLVDSLVNNLISYFPVTWCLKKSQGYRTDNFYASDPSWTVESCVNGVTKYTGYTVTLTMQ